MCGQICARLENAFHAVAYEHVGRGQLREQRLVGGRALPGAPLPGEHLAVLAVDRRQQAPAVHVGAVGHDHAVHHAIRFDARLEPPAPVHAFAEVARALRAFALRRGLEQPVQELRQLGAAPFGVVPGAGGQPAFIALPTLPAHAVVSVLAHRRLADRAFLRLLRTCPHDTHCTRNHASRWTPPSATGRHAYCHKGKPESKSITLVPICPYLSYRLLRRRAHANTAVPAVRSATAMAAIIRIDESVRAICHLMPETLLPLAGLLGSEGLPALAGSDG